MQLKEGRDAPQEQTFLHRWQVLSDTVNSATAGGDRVDIHLCHHPSRVQLGEQILGIFVGRRVTELRHDHRAIDGQVMEIRCPGLEIDQAYFSLLGDFQLQNLAVALTSLMILKQQGYNIRK